MQTAEAWVLAIGCDCTINTDIFVESLGGVISEAALDIYSRKCAGTFLFSFSVSHPEIRLVATML